METSQRIFVSEYVCGGGWPSGPLDTSLTIEGKAMLLAVIEDLLAAGFEIFTTWDKRLGSFPENMRDDRLSVHLTNPESESKLFEELCRTSDRVLIIAPEFHGILAERTRIASELSMLLGCDEHSVNLCSDKLMLAHFLSKKSPTQLGRNAGTVPTAPIDLDAPKRKWPFPIVMKPQDGAGSIDTFLIKDDRQLTDCCRNLLAHREGGHSSFNFIQQPFIQGPLLSAATIISSDDSRHFLPVCQPVMSADERFEYLGARWNRLQPDTQLQNRIESLLGKILDQIPGLHGYVGFDLIEQDGKLNLLEINPRLTTGYLAWRSRRKGNLGAMLTGQEDRSTWLGSKGEFRLADLG